MKKIAFVTEYYYPVNNAPATRFTPLVEELSKYFRVTLYTSNRSKATPGITIKSNVVNFPENTKTFGARLLFELAYAIETFCRLLFSRADIYYITSPSYFNCMAAYFYCRLFKRTYVIDIRDDYPRIFFDNNLVKETSLLGRCLKSLERKFYRDAFQVVTATEGLAQNIRTLYTGSVYVLRNGFSEQLFNHSPEKYPLFTLVFHGNLSVYQGIDSLLAIARILEERQRRLQILIIGSGSDAYKLEESNSSIIRYLGPKPHHEIGKIISKAHVGLSLRKPGKISEDAFPVRAYEYIGACLPIVVTPRSEAGRFIERAEIGFQFDNSEEVQIVSAIESLMDDHDLYCKMISNLRTERLQFSRQQQCRIFVEFLNARIQKTAI